MLTFKHRDPSSDTACCTDDAEGGEADAAGGTSGRGTCPKTFAWDSRASEANRASDDLAYPWEACNIEKIPYAACGWGAREAQQPPTPVPPWCMVVPLDFMTYQVPPPRARAPLKPEDLVGRWTDSLGNQVHCGYTDFTETKMIATLSKPSRVDIVLTLRPQFFGSWQCGNSDLDLAWSTPEHLYWLAPNGRSSEWFRLPEEAQEIVEEEENSVPGEYFFHEHLKSPTGLSEAMTSTPCNASDDVADAADRRSSSSNSTA